MAGRTFVVGDVHGELRHLSTLLARLPALDAGGKRVICGHTATEDLPVELSTYTPEDPTDLWYRGAVVAIDTRCGKEGGFLTALELPALKVYESR